MIINLIIGFTNTENVDIAWMPLVSAFQTKEFIGKAYATVAARTIAIALFGDIIESRSTLPAPDLEIDGVAFGHLRPCKTHLAVLADDIGRLLRHLSVTLF